MFNKFLDEALTEMHISPAKIIMIMAQTFFRKIPVSPSNTEESNENLDTMDPLLHPPEILENVCFSVKCVCNLEIGRTYSRDVWRQIAYVNLYGKG